MTAQDGSSSAERLGGGGGCLKLPKSIRFYWVKVVETGRIVLDKCNLQAAGGAA